MRVVLTKEQRVKMPAGSVVEVDALTADWLIGNGAAAKEEKPAPKKAAKEKK
jgi:hypothetical protein